MTGPRDDNRVVVLMGVSTVDGSPTPVRVNPVTGRVLAQGADEGVTATVGTDIKRDDNHVPVGAGVKTTDGSPIPFHVTPGGKLLVKYNP